MEQEPRKATDVLLELESKINVLLDIVRTQDLNIKILSNKLNDIIGRLEKRSPDVPKVIVEAVQVSQPKQPISPQIPVEMSEKAIPVVPEMTLPQTDNPQGFRRNSRPETYVTEKKMPVQLPPNMPSPSNFQQVAPPGRRPSEVNAPMEAMSNKNALVAAHQAEMPKMTEEKSVPFAIQNQIPVQQRCVDKNGKSIYLAPVEITDLSTGQLIKARTNGNGKWMASLSVGVYRVIITKQATQNKEKLESIQDIKIDGSQSPLELPMVIIK